MEQIIIDEINGTDIEDIKTRKSMYDQNSVTCIVDSKPYLLHVDEILKMASEFRFKQERKEMNTYLKLIEVKK